MLMKTKDSKNRQAEGGRQERGRKGKRQRACPERSEGGKNEEQDAPRKDRG